MLLNKACMMIAATRPATAAFLIHQVSIVVQMAANSITWSIIFHVVDLLSESICSAYSNGTSANSSITPENDSYHGSAINIPLAILKHIGRLFDRTIFMRLDILHKF